jgi:hypothetical protein
MAYGIRTITLFIEAKIYPGIQPITFFSLTLAAFLHFPLHYSPFVFKLSPEAGSKRMYWNEPFVEVRRIGTYIKAHSLPHDRILNFGAEPEVMFYAQRKSASGFLYAYPLIENQKYADQLRQQWFSEIENSQPAYLLFSYNGSTWIVDSTSRQCFEWFDNFKKDYVRCAVVNINPKGNSEYYYGKDCDTIKTNGISYLELYKYHEETKKPVL